MPDWAPSPATSADWACSLGAWGTRASLVARASCPVSLNNFDRNPSGFHWAGHLILVNKMRILYLITVANIYQTEYLDPFLVNWIRTRNLSGG